MNHSNVSDGFSRDACVPGLPPAQGLYHPNQEHDACGIGFAAVAAVAGTGAEATVTISCGSGVVAAFSARGEAAVAGGAGGVTGAVKAAATACKACGAAAAEICATAGAGPGETA